MVEQSLRTSLELATKWHSIVLLDEADVFMEERTRENLLRNELVSGASPVIFETHSSRGWQKTNTGIVLLRTLEYFEGIMFLTTNRATSIDPAFKSRIHLSISYQPLSFQSRKELWKTFLLNGAITSEMPWLDEKAFNKIAKAPINGRQIKNIVRIAHCRAVNGKRDMRLEDILLGLHALQLFEEDFTKAKKETENERGGGRGRRGVAETGAVAVAGALVALGIIFGVRKIF